MKQFKKTMAVFMAAFFSGAQWTFANNSTTGTTPDGCKTYRAEVAFGTRHLLAKPGSGAGEVDICGAEERPIGLVPDEPAIDEPAAVHLLGATLGTKKMVADGEVVANEAVYTAAGGKVQDLPVAAGTYYQVGWAVTGATDDEVEVVPIFPIETTVA